jgi:hypothetical protein
MEVQLQKSWPRYWMEVSGQFHAPAVLPAWCPFNSTLGEPQNRSGRCEEKSLLHMLGIKPRPPSPQPVYYTDWNARAINVISLRLLIRRTMNKHILFKSIPDYPNAYLS